jgi:hypothetical protein
MLPRGLAAGLAIAAGEASIDEDVCAWLTAPKNSKNGRTSSISRIVASSTFSVLSPVMSAGPRRITSFL